MGTLGGAESDVIIGWRVIVLVVIVERSPWEIQLLSIRPIQYPPYLRSMSSAHDNIIYMQTGVVNATMTKTKMHKSAAECSNHLYSTTLSSYCSAALTVSCCPAGVFSA